MFDLGSWIAWQKMRTGFWKKAFFIALGLLVVANFFIHPHHPHFGLDAYPGFWAVFGFGLAVILTFVLKKLIFPVIGKDEDFYERSE